MPGADTDVGTLEEDLSRPATTEVALMQILEGDLLVLGVAGKMGPTLARLARRATDMAGRPRRVIGVSRFSDEDVRRRLESWGVETIAADLLDEGTFDSLPDARNVIFMAGKKFGTAGSPSGTWAANAYLPVLAARRYARSRIVVFSSGNVYPFTESGRRPPDESAPVAPVGEYAQSVLARERLFEYFSAQNGTPTAIMRLNYAVEPRYGVLRDIADRVISRTPVDVSMGQVNFIWQTDANAIALHLLLACASPACVLNVTGEHVSVRWIAQRFGDMFDVAPRFRGAEQGSSLLSDASKCRSLFGRPRVDTESMIERVGRWVLAGGPGLGKPTHFEEREGSF